MRKSSSCAVKARSSGSTPSISAFRSAWKATSDHFSATRDFSFDTGDIIVLHTDGVTEAEGPDGELFGLERLCDSARRHRNGSADDVKNGIISDLMAHIGTQKIHDDITLVVMRHR